MAAPTSPQRAVAQLYTALFNRAPDADGFGFWVRAVENGASLSLLAQSMMASPEAAALYPAGQTDAEFVAGYYTSVFGRTPDANGLAFWSAALAAQGGAGSAAARAALTVQINAVVSTPLVSKPADIGDAEYAQAVADRARFTNKMEFGVYFATELKSNDLALAKSSFSLVTDNPASLTAAVNLANGVVPPAPPPPATDLTITAADAEGVIASKFAGYAYSNARVDATHMTAAQLSAVAAAVDKVAVDGITGTLALGSAQTDVELGALLGTKTALAATVEVSGAGMSTAQLAAVGAGAANVDMLTALPMLVLNDPLLTDPISTGLMSKATAFSVNATGASTAELTTLLANLSKVPNGGIAGALTLNAADLTTANAGGSLSAKFAAGATLTIAGNTADDVIDVSNLTKGVRIDGGGVADRIVLGNGADTVFIGSQSATQNAPALTDTDTSHILTIANFRADDVIRFSTDANAFGNGITLQAGAIARVGTMTNAVDILTLGDIVSIVNSVRTLLPTPESTSGAPKIYTLNSYVYNNGVTPGGLANKTFFILNDGNSEITLNDTIIAVENFIYTVGGAEAKFEAGI